MLGFDADLSFSVQVGYQMYDAFKYVNIVLLFLLPPRGVDTARAHCNPLAVRVSCGLDFESCLTSTLFGTAILCTVLLVI